MSKMSEDLKLSVASPCDPEVYANGVHVATLVVERAYIVEAIVIAARGLCPGMLKMDWHYVGGRACVRAIGTPEQLEQARVALHRCAQIQCEVWP